VVIKQEKFFFVHFKVNTKREPRSSNNKNFSNQSFDTIGALVTGLTSTPTMSDEINQADILTEPAIVDEQNNISTPPPTHIDHSGVDSGLSSEIEKSNGNQHDISSTSGVIIPEEKRVTDRVKVFEAVAKNGNKKKSSTSSSFSVADQKQISPTSIDSFDSQSINEMKTSKNKSKKSSLKKQIQNLLKIDKPSIQDDFNSIDEQINGKKNKKDPSKKYIYIFF
jgi:hypothetical protein